MSVKTLKYIKIYVTHFFLTILSFYYSSLHQNSEINRPVSCFASVNAAIVIIIIITDCLGSLLLVWHAVETRSQMFNSHCIHSGNAR